MSAPSREETDDALSWREIVAEDLEAFRAELAELRAAIEDLQGAPHNELSEEQRREMQVIWSQVACRYCGTVHAGTCPRIAEIRRHPNGAEERVIFWPNSEWEPPRGAITAADVFGVPVEIPEITAGVDGG